MCECSTYNHTHIPIHIQFNLDYTLYSTTKLSLNLFNARCRCRFKISNPCKSLIEFDRILFYTFSAIPQFISLLLK